MTALYQEHFGLHKAPFQITPDTDYFFAGSRRGELLDALLHVAQHDEGIVTVVAEVGCGKTLLARQMIGQLPDGISTIYLANPCFNRDEILGAIGRDLGLGEMPDSIGEKLAALQQELLRRHAAGERVLLVIDEAHAMPAESLEEVRLLSNLETGTHKLVNIMLFGQPELDALLADPRLRQVRDRVIHRFELAPFSREDGAAYIDHRLRIAGWQGDDKLFTDAAAGVVLKAAGGRARRINLLADKALHAAYAESLPQVEKRHAREASLDLPAPTNATAPRPWLGFALPRLSLASSVLVLALAGTAVWGYTWSQLSPTAEMTANAPTAPEPEKLATAPAQTTPAADKGAHAGTDAPKDKAANADKTTKQTPRSAGAEASTRSPVAAAKAPVPAQAGSQAAKPKPAPLVLAAASTSTSGAAPSHSPGLKLDTELASVQRIVPFAVSTAALGPNGRKALAEIVPLAKQAERVNVRGRTDSSGNRKQNRQLAKARATSVMFAFVAEGVARKNLKATFCTTCFVASNDTTAGRRTNRRVDIEVVMPAKLARNLPKPVYSALDADEGPALLARLDDHFTIGKRSN